MRILFAVQSDKAEYYGIEYLLNHRHKILNFVQIIFDHSRVMTHLADVIKVSEVYVVMSSNANYRPRTSGMGFP